ncbi:unnamed protein product [Prorocentrum cordatum]|uniref:Uncharacterized protein n=1 Tax=Prorocentrum cordatum TaxID=2364126 RepID=A0ABN9Q0F1_9DINO|nr:unnamed protein product [Polarella glacialis]
MMDGGARGTILKEAALPGAIFTRSGIFWHGIEARRAAARRGRRDMKKFWTEGKHAALGAATSGLTGLVLRRAQHDKLDLLRRKFGRVLPDGSAVRVPVDDGSGGAHEVARATRATDGSDWDCFRQQQQIAAVFGDLEMEMAKVPESAWFPAPHEGFEGLWAHLATRPPRPLPEFKWGIPLPPARDMGGLFDQVPEAAKDTTIELRAGRRRQREEGGDAEQSECRGKTRGHKQNNRVVAHEEIDNLEKMGVEQLRTLVPVLTKMALNRALGSRQVEAAILTALIIGANTEPVVKAQGRAKAWIEKALKTKIAEITPNMAAETFSLVKVQATLKETEAGITINRLDMLQPLHAGLELLGATVKHGWRLAFVRIDTLEGNAIEMKLQLLKKPFTKLLALGAQRMRAGPSDPSLKYLRGPGAPRETSRTSTSAAASRTRRPRPSPSWTPWRGRPCGLRRSRGKRQAAAHGGPSRWCSRAPAARWWPDPGPRWRGRRSAPRPRRGASARRDPLRRTDRPSGGHVAGVSPLTLSKLAEFQGGLFGAASSSARASPSAPAASAHGASAPPTSEEVEWAAVPEDGRAWGRWRGRGGRGHTLVVAEAVSRGAAARPAGRGPRGGTPQRQHQQRGGGGAGRRLGGRAAAAAAREGEAAAVPPRRREPPEVLREVRPAVGREALVRHHLQVGQAAGRRQRAAGRRARGQTGVFLDPRARRAALPRGRQRSGVLPVCAGPLVQLRARAAPVRRGRGPSWLGPRGRRGQAAVRGRAGGPRADIRRAAGGQPEGGRARGRGRGEGRLYVDADVEAAYQGCGFRWFQLTQCIRRSRSAFRAAKIKPSLRFLVFSAHRGPTDPPRPSGGLQPLSALLLRSDEDATARAEAQAAASGESISSFTAW